MVVFSNRCIHAVATLVARCRLRWRYAIFVPGLDRRALKHASTELHPMHGVLVVPIHRGNPQPEMGKQLP